MYELLRVNMSLGLDPSIPLSCVVNCSSELTMMSWRLDILIRRLRFSRADIPELGFTIAVAKADVANSRGAASTDAAKLRVLILRQGCQVFLNRATSSSTALRDLLAPTS